MARHPERQPQLPRFRHPVKAQKGLRRAISCFLEVRPKIESWVSEVSARPARNTPTLPGAPLPMLQPCLSITQCDSAPAVKAVTLRPPLLTAHPRCPAIDALCLSADTSAGAVSPAPAQRSSQAPA